MTDAVFWAECDEESGGQVEDGQEDRHFSSYKLPKTVTVTTLLLFGPVMLLCGAFLCIYLSGGAV